MAKKSMVRKVFVNKKTKQLSVSLSKKELKARSPSIKFDEDLFVSLHIFNKGKRK